MNECAVRAIQEGLRRLYIRYGTGLLVQRKPSEVVARGDHYSSEIAFALGRVYSPVIAPAASKFGSAGVNANRLALAQASRPASAHCDSGVA